MSIDLHKGMQNLGNDLKMLNEINEILYYLHLDLERNSCVIECEDGSGSFVSTGAINGFVSRLKRSLKDEDYRKKLLTLLKKESQYE